MLAYSLPLFPYKTVCAICADSYTSTVIYNVANELALHIVGEHCIRPNFTQHGIEGQN